MNQSLPIPTSKSYSNRLLILAALTPRSVTLSHLSHSSDTRTLLDCLRKMGLDIEQQGHLTTIANSFPLCEPSHPVTLESGDGGTTNRFLAALAARGKQRYRLLPAGSMKKRPLKGLLDGLEQRGVRVTRGDGNSFEITGPLRLDSGEIPMDCSATTQFASALMLATAGMGVPVRPIHGTSSGPYLALTEHLLRTFPKADSTPYRIPPDMSSLGYPLALGMVHGRVVIENCRQADTLQADSAILTIARRMGARVDRTTEGLAAQSGTPLAPLTWDASDCPDLVPTLAFLASCARGTSHLRGLAVLRHKESDRIREILRLLDAFRVKCAFDKQSDSLSITGPASDTPFLSYHPPDDHRMVMTAYLFMRKNSGGLLSNTRQVEKSFPGFFEVMESPLSESE